MNWDNPVLLPSSVKWEHNTNTHSGVAVSVQRDGQVFVVNLFGELRLQYQPWPAGVTQRLAPETGPGEAGRRLLH